MYCDATKQARVDAQILSLDVVTQQTNQRGCLRVLRDAVKLYASVINKAVKLQTRLFCHCNYTRVQNNALTVWKAMFASSSVASLAVFETAALVCL